MGVSLPFALGAPYLLARVQFPGRVLFDALVHLPLRLPPVLTGYVLLVLFGRAGPIGRVLEATPGLTFAFRWTGAVIAAAVMAFPLFVRAIRLSLEAIPHDIDDMAASLGARPWATFFQVLLPLSLPGIARLAVVSIPLAVGALLASEWLARRSAYRRRNLL